MSIELMHGTTFVLYSRFAVAANLRGRSLSQSSPPCYSETAPIPRRQTIANALAWLLFDDCNYGNFPGFVFDLWTQARLVRDLLVITHSTTLTNVLTK